MKVSDYDNIILNHRKRQRSYGDLIKYFKDNDVLAEHYLSENYFKLTQKRIKGNMKIDPLYGTFVFKNEKLDEVYMYKTPDGLLYYSNPPHNLEILYPVLSNDLWPNKKNEETCYLSSNTLPIDVFSLICYNLTIKDLLNLIKCSKLLSNRLKNDKRCWKAHVAKLQELCPTITDLITGTLSFYDILIRIMIGLKNSNTILKFKKRCGTKYFPFLLNCLFPAGNYINFISDDNDLEHLRFTFKDHCDEKSVTHYDPKKRCFENDFSFCSSLNICFNDFKNNITKLLSCNADMDNIISNLRDTHPISWWLIKGTILGCMCHDSDKCKRNCRLPGQFKLKFSSKISLRKWIVLDCDNNFDDKIFFEIQNLEKKRDIYGLEAIRMDGKVRLQFYCGKNK
jgi:hypothetical protein